MLLVIVLTIVRTLVGLHPMSTSPVLAQVQGQRKRPESVRETSMVYLGFQTLVLSYPAPEQEVRHSLLPMCKVLNLQSDAFGTPHHTHDRELSRSPPASPDVFVHPYSSLHPYLKLTSVS